MSDRSLKSVTHFSFDQLSEEEQEVLGALVLHGPLFAFSAAEITNWRKSACTCHATGVNSVTDTQKFDSCSDVL